MSWTPIIYVSSLLVKQGLSAQVLDAWRRGAYQLITSPAIIAEVRHTLGYARIRRKYGITDEDVDALLLPLLNSAVVLAAALELPSTLLRDPDDVQILACAVAGLADVIVSGDQDLLTLGAYQGIPILTVRAFLTRPEMASSE